MQGNVLYIWYLHWKKFRDIQIRRKSILYSYFQPIALETGVTGNDFVFQPDNLFWPILWIYNIFWTIHCNE